MKVDITYEKKDVLRLVQKDMEAQGIRVKAGTALEYKGALQVRFSVETEDDTPAKMPETKATPAEPVLTATEEEASMAGLLGKNRQLVMTSPGKFEQRPPRALVRNEMMQESVDFPDDKEGGR